MLRQTLRLTALAISSLGSRLATSSIIVVGVGGVVAVLVGLLAMASGFNAALVETGRADRALVLRTGADDELTSWLTMEELAVLAGVPGVEAASGELFVVADLVTRDTGKPGVAIVRGVSAAAFDMRPELGIVAGRKLRAGHHEVIAGTGAVRVYRGLELGAQVELRSHTWTVVGHFRGAGAHDSEIWADLAGAQAAFRRTGAVSSARVHLASPGESGTVARLVQDDPRLTAELVTERDFYAAQSRARTRLIESFAHLVAGIMAAGALIAAYSTMHAAVSARTVEIATLRAFGFRRAPIVASVLLEAAALSVLGGALGGGAVYLLYDGYAASTLDDGSLSQVVFQFAVTAELVAVGLVLALLIGITGAVPPAVRAARMGIAAALRGA